MKEWTVFLGLADQLVGTQISYVFSYTIMSHNWDKTLYHSGETHVLKITLFLHRVIHMASNVQVSYAVHIEGPKSRKRTFFYTTLFFGSH